MDRVGQVNGRVEVQPLGDRRVAAGYAFPLVLCANLGYVKAVRQMQPNKAPRNKSPKGPRQDIPSEAARIQARLAGRAKKPADAAAPPAPKTT
jgi:hypothetical protein